GLPDPPPRYRLRARPPRLVRLGPGSAGARGRRLDQSELNRSRHDADPAVGGELALDVGDVDARGLPADEQDFCDLRVRTAGSDKLEHLALPGREVVPAAR